MQYTPINESDTRERILAAADARFRQFGYNKTTMAEIAGDCKMSAANLYRFFKNKLDIGAGLASYCLGNKETLLRDVVNQTQLTASERLQQFVLTSLHYVFEQCSDQPRMNEMVQAIIQEKRELVAQHSENKLALLIELIEQGNTSGEFNVANPAVAAGSILSAIVLFDTPVFIHMYSLETFENMAKDVVDTLLGGLQKT